MKQVNSTRGPGWKIWDQGRQEQAADLLAFRAAQAARRQGRFEPVHHALLRARHEERRDLEQLETVLDCARQAGLDPLRLRAELDDPSLLDALATDHTEAVERHGVFGTPTLVFDGGGAAYLRMRPPPPPEETMEVWDTLQRTIAGRPYLLELKRP